MVRIYFRGLIFLFAVFIITFLFSFKSEKAWSKDASSRGNIIENSYLSPSNIEKNILSGIKNGSKALHYLKKNYGTDRLIPLWRKKELTYGIIGSSGNEYKRLIYFFLNDIYKPTGLSLKFDGRADIIFIVEDNAIRNLQNKKENVFYKIGLNKIAANNLRESLKGGSCSHSVFPDRNGDLVTAIIIVDTAAPEKSITRCLYDGITMSTGFMPENRKLYSLSEENPTPEKHLLDKISINILYHILRDGKEVTLKTIKKYIRTITSERN